MDTEQGSYSTPERTALHSTDRSLNVTKNRMLTVQPSIVVLTVHVSFVLVLDKCVTTRLPRLLVVDYVNLKQMNNIAWN